MKPCFFPFRSLAASCPCQARPRVGYGLSFFFLCFVAFLRGYDEQDVCLALIPKPQRALMSEGAGGRLCFGRRAEVLTLRVYFRLGARKPREKDLLKAQRQDPSAIHRETSTRSPPKPKTPKSPKTLKPFSAPLVVPVSICVYIYVHMCKHIPFVLQTWQQGCGWP